MRLRTTLLILPVLVAPAFADNAVILAPAYVEPVAKASSFNPLLLQQMCAQAVQKEVAYPVVLGIRRVDAVPGKDDAFNCVVEADLREYLHPATRTSFRQFKVTYAVSGSVKTGQMTVARTDVAKAQEVAMLAAAKLFVDLKPSSIEPAKVVFDATLAGGKKCAITVAQDSIKDASPWLVSDIRCSGKTANR